MKTQINSQRRLYLQDISKFGNREYYFHPDEDFREDWDWGKISDDEFPEDNCIKSPYSTLGYHEINTIIKKQI